MSAHPPDQRCWAEIDLAAFERNVRRIQAELPSDVRYVSVVKADAYGHGMPHMVRRLMQSGVDCFAVANVAEAAEIRHMGSGWPILILSPVLPYEQAKLLEYDLSATISTETEAHTLNELAKRKNSTLKVHLKIDTGMGRLGVWYESARALFDSLQAYPHLKLEGIYTHFSSADSDPTFTQLQRQRLLDFLEQVPIDDLLIHADNSASLESLSGQSPFNAVRVGLLQLGIPYPQSLLGSIHVEPVFSFHTRIGLIKELPPGTDISYSRTYTLNRTTRIGILTAGYGDGIPLTLSNRGEVLIHGRRCPILGRVTMDQTIVDLSGATDARVGDIATLIGQHGDETISAAEFSQTAETIPWETLCSITKRVTRTYLGLREI